MKTAEQVRAEIVSRVTGRAVVETIHAEAGDPISNASSDAAHIFVERRRLLSNRFGQSAEEMGVYDKVILPDAHSALPSTDIAPEERELLDAFRLGFANVFVYRAFKALEARVSRLEGGR